MLVCSVNFVHAQTERMDIQSLEELYHVKIDSVAIQKTPYRQIEIDGVIRDEDKKIDWYNDITIYEISPKQDVQAKSGAKPAIFMLPGGGFFGMSSSDVDGMNLSGNLSLGSKLANNLNSEVYIIRYITNNASEIENVVFATNDCEDTQNEIGKSLLIEASYKAFHDLRKILKINFLDSAAIKNIDPENFFLIGSSAGAILALNTLFLQQSEIPTSITYKNNCSNNNTTTILIDTNSVKNQYWPIPKMKGVVSMAGAWIYENTNHLTENTLASTYETPIYMLHGTCDELVHRVGPNNIGFKIYPLFNVKNTNPNRFIEGLGSTVIFNAFKDTHEKLGYGQVCKGSHTIFGNHVLGIFPGWDLINWVLDPTNLTDPLTAHIQPFIGDLINGTSTWETHTEVWNPEKISTKCKTFDNFDDTICHRHIPTPNISYDDYLCNSLDKNATLSNLPTGTYTINWSTTGNVEIVGSNSGQSILYKKSNNTIDSGTLVVEIVKECSSRQFVYPIYMSNHPKDILMTSTCYNGNMGKLTRAFPSGTSATFSVLFPNAAAGGVSTINWTINCGMTTPIINEYFIGNDLYSEITFTNYGGVCDWVQAKFLNPCGGNITLKRKLATAECGSLRMGLKIYPNPSNDYLRISLDEEFEEMKSENGIEIKIIDPMGTELSNFLLHSRNENIDIRHLKPGVYKIIVHHEGEYFYSTFIKN